MFSYLAFFVVKLYLLYFWRMLYNDTPFSHEHFMRQALREAEEAFAKDEVPVGAVIVMNNKIIARGYNQVELLNDSTRPHHRLSGNGE